jgi:hypothetical protein
MYARSRFFELSLGFLSFHLMKRTPLGGLFFQVCVLMRALACTLPWVCKFEFSVSAILPRKLADRRTSKRTDVQLNVCGKCVRLFTLQELALVETRNLPLPKHLCC